MKFKSNLIFDNKRRFQLNKLESATITAFIYTEE